MNRGLLALIIIIIVAIIVGVGLYSQYYYKNVGVNNTTGINASANNTTSTNNTVATVVTIQNGSFNPNNITINSGTNVQWINRDNTTHQVVSDTGTFQSPILNPGDVWNFYFAKSGVFGYHDSYNPSETGTVTVS